MTKHNVSIFWFRNDLRLTDNPGLHAALEASDKVVPVFILEDGTTGARPLGAATKWWLHHSLKALAGQINDIGGALILRRGDPREHLNALIQETGASAVFWNRRYGKASRDYDAGLKSDLKAHDIAVESFNGRLLTEPWEIETKSGGHYKVFTPYWRAVKETYSPPAPCPAPESIKSPKADSDTLDDWGLLPTSPNWADGFEDPWTPGEVGAHERLSAWLDGPINDYDDARNRPDLGDGTSGLSPHLRWGEIGPAQIWRAVKDRMDRGDIGDKGAMTFLSEIVWREFSYVLMFHYPRLHEDNYNSDFQHMPWRSAKGDLAAWTAGRTGYPIVDAGMRQLWAIGWMHNRVRMIVGSFLTKHLLIHWSEGEDWFWDTLVDADPASNAAGWQWVAGSGADAAPYFRVFNPITQGEKFDETGDYVRKWCPELAELPRKYLYSPWTAPKDALEKAGVVLGDTYPHPIIEHKDGRQRALDAYDTLKERRERA